jgi:hypothetical protein
LDPIHTTKASAGPRLFTRAEALKILRVGETTLHWLQRTPAARLSRPGLKDWFRRRPYSSCRNFCKARSLTEIAKCLTVPTHNRLASYVTCVGLAYDENASHNAIAVSAADKPRFGPGRPPMR